MEIKEFFSNVEKTISSKFKESGFTRHAGDKGANREQILRKFLAKHLPRKYGVTRGELITGQGKHTHSVDIIIYDALNCPILYSGDTEILPIEGVYGIIEVKSKLSKDELLDAVKKIESFKKIAPRSPSLIRTRESVTLHMPSRPFGVVLGYELGGNSLSTLFDNFCEANHNISIVNYIANLVVVLGVGLLHYEKINLLRGDKLLFLDTDDIVTLAETVDKRRRNKETVEDLMCRLIKEELGNDTFGRFFVYLLMMLEKMKLNIPDIGRLLDPSLPFIIHRES